MKQLVIAIWLLIISSSVLGQQNGEVSDFGASPSEQGRRHDASINGGAKVQYLDANGQPVLVQFTYVGPPKILPISTADSYPEGSSINLICTVSGGQRQGLVLNWLKDGDDIDGQALRYSEQFSNVVINMDDADISRLKITNATLKNSGQYTCNARNPLGQDSTSVKIVINVEMKWIRTPKDQVEIGIGQELTLECDAAGSPTPIVEWYKVSSGNQQALEGGDASSTLISKGKQLKLTRTHDKDSGLYECVAKNGADENLRKIVQLKIRGK